MNIVYAKDPKWANPEKTLIDVTVRFENFAEDLQFTANPNDVEDHGRELYERSVNGDFGAVADYTPPSNEVLAFSARVKRDLMLSSSDWTQLPDVPQATKDAWATYRQALRDVTSQAGFPSNITWPTPPQ